MTKQIADCRFKEEVAESEISAGKVVLALADDIVGRQSNGLVDLFPFLLAICTIFNLISVETQAVPSQREAKEHYGSVAKKTESCSESNQSSNDKMQRQDQNPLIVWTEPKGLRKIQTTSLLLRRRKKKRQWHQSKETVLRLRGGAAETNEERDRKKPVRTSSRRFSTSQLNTTRDCLGDTFSGLQRSLSAPELRIRYTSVDDNGGDLVKNNDALPLLSVVGGSFQRNSDKNRHSLHSLERPHSWRDWEQDRQMLRPPPLASPRQPDLAYLNMTVDEAANEDGIEHYDLAKDAYRRADAQVQVVREAQRDQRKVAGGIYQCQEDGKENFYLHVMKGTDKLLGIKLVHNEPPQKPQVQFETFAMMDYERYVQCSSQRVRVNLPEETETGFIWHGHGGNQYPLSSSVYQFCERVDNDSHYSAEDCERATEAPGASQLMCSSKSCGVIFWHLSVLFFHRTKANHFEEAGQEHFAVMMLKSKEHMLLWTDKAGKQTRWTRLEHSPAYERIQVFQGSMERIRYVVAEGLLPQCNFLLPAYSPLLRTWQEPQPLKRIPSTCKW